MNLGMIWRICVLIVPCGALAMTGCARLMHAQKPLHGMEKVLSDDIKNRYTEASKKIVHYYDKYDSSFEALAKAATEYDRALSDLNAAIADRVELRALRQLTEDRLATLPERTDALIVSTVNLQLAALDEELAIQEGTVVHAQRAANQAKDRLDAGYNGLAIMAAAQKQALGRNRYFMAADGQLEYRRRIEFTNDLIAQAAELAAPKPGEQSDVQSKRIFGFGQIYLAAMKRDRNDILNELIPAAQEFHKSLQRSLFFSRGAMNIGFDGALLATTGTASVAGSEKAARVLSALATALGGLRESIDKELFFQQASPALLLLMRADAEAKEAKLYEGMALDIDKYSLEDGIRDYNTFLLAGQLTDAIMGLSAEAVEKASEANVHLMRLQEAAKQNLTEIEKRAAQKQAEKQRQVQGLMDEVDKLTGGVSAVIE